MVAQNRDELLCVQVTFSHSVQPTSINLFLALLSHGSVRFKLKANYINIYT